MTPSAPGESGPRAGLLADALARCRTALPHADNVGRTRDDRDIYQLLDDVAAGVQAGMAQSRCGRGCDSCCRYPQAFFNVHPEEWELIADHLRVRWSEDRLLDFLARFHRALGRLSRGRLALAQLLLDLPLPLRPRPTTFLVQCPFLENHECSIYEARPWKCRAFGWFSYRRILGGRLDAYACDLQAEALSGAGSGPRLALPSATPFHTRIWRLFGGRSRSLPRWILETWPQGASGRAGAVSPGRDRAR